MRNCRIEGILRRMELQRQLEGACRSCSCTPFSVMPMTVSEFFDSMTDNQYNSLRMIMAMENEWKKANYLLSMARMPLKKKKEKKRLCLPFGWREIRRRQKVG